VRREIVDRQPTERVHARDVRPGQRGAGGQAERLAHQVQLPVLDGEIWMKAALLHEFNRTVAEEFRASLREPRGSARDELRALVERMSIELVAQAEIMTAMIAEFFASPEALSPASRDDALPVLVTEILLRGQERGEFSDRIDARLAAASFLATAGAIVSGQVFGARDITPAEINRQFLQLTFSGLSPSGEASAEEPRPRQRSNQRSRR